VSTQSSADLFLVAGTMAMAARILTFFVCEFVCGFGAIVVSPAHSPLPAEAAAAAGIQWKGRTIANKLQRV